MIEQPSKLPSIGEEAPSFKAETAQEPIKFPDDFKETGWNPGG